MDSPGVNVGRARMGNGRFHVWVDFSNLKSCNALP
jgi:hypothetical protein